MKQKTKKRISLKAILIVALLLVAIILPNFSSMLTVNAATMYTVKLYDHDGTLIEQESIESGTYYTLDYTGKGKTGYKFDYWDAGSKYYENGESVKITSNLSATAVMIANQTTTYYTVTFALNGGTLVSGTLSQSIPSGGNATPPTVKRDGYTFNGWSGTYTNVTSNRTVTAQWTQEVTETRYTVTFNLNGGTRTGGGALSQSIASGGSATVPTVKRDGYIFDGWSGTYTNVISDRTVTAQWKPDTQATFTVQFYLDDNAVHIGGGDLVQSVIYGGSPILPIVTRDGYKFIKWYGDDYSSVTKNMNLYADWEPETKPYFTVTFDPNGGVWAGGGELVQSVIYGGYIEQANYPIVTREGYVFYGWSGGNYVSNVTQDETKYAVWEPEVKPYFTVTFDLNGGTLVSGELVQSVIYGGSATPPTVSRDGYEFLCWLHIYTDITDDIVVIAEWKKIEERNYYIVTFDLNGGISSSDVELIQYIVPGYNATPPGVYRDDYVFIGWDGDYLDIRSDITITAIWEKRYEVRFDLNGGTLVSGKLLQNIIPGGNAELPIVERDGYIFKCWDGDYLNITSKRTISAMWDKDLTNTYFTVTFDLNGGTLISGELIQSIIYGGSAIMPIIEYEGYEIDGWIATGSYTNVVSDVLITIQWREPIVYVWYTVTFNYNGGTHTGGGGTVQSVISGSYATAPILTRNGYTFNGWDKSLDNITSDCTITAKWVKNGTSEQDKEPTIFDKVGKWISDTWYKIFPKKVFKFWPWEWDDNTKWTSYLVFSLVVILVIVILIFICIIISKRKGGR